MSDMETRVTFRLKEDDKRKAMSIAALRGMFGFSEVMREALALWIAREEIRPQTDEWLAMTNDDSDIYASSAINLLEHILEASK